MGGGSGTGGGGAMMPARRPVTVCLTGACSDLSANCGSNQGFTDICDALAALDAGIVRSSSGTTFATALSNNASTVAGPLFTALDKNGDNKVDALDGLIDLNILGFSWGGKNSDDLANRVVTDTRIDRSVIHSRVIVMDGYQPFETKVAIPAGIDRAWSFRHSVAPATDCSNGAPLGPYLGLRLACASGQQCSDYDFSIAPSTQTFNGYHASNIGHCDVPYAAHDFVMSLVLTGQPGSNLPPSVPVTP